MLKLMFITNNPKTAMSAEAAGVDRIFVDMEYIGKDERQKGLNTVMSHHTIEDVAAVRKAVKKAELLVRVNPIHEATSDYTSSEEEINAAIEAGADIVMLPYFKTIDEVRRFIGIVNGRAKAMLLLETESAMQNVDRILEIEGIDEIHIGLNDLSIDLGKKFMFELLADGTVEKLCLKFRKKGIPYGFGGIASIGNGAVPAEYIIKEHYRLGSRAAILSRSFCNTAMITDEDIIKRALRKGVAEIRELEGECEKHSRFFFENERKFIYLVDRISRGE